MHINVSSYLSIHGYISIYLFIYLLYIHLPIDFLWNPKIINAKQKKILIENGLFYDANLWFTPVYKQIIIILIFKSKSRFSY